MNKYIRRALYFTPAAILLAFTLFIFAPIEMYFQNSENLWFQLKDIALMISLYFISTVLLLVFVGSLIRCKKAFSIYNAVIIGIGLGFYVQGNFLNNDYGSLDGTPIIWSDYTLRAAVGVTVWVLCILMPLVVRWLSQQYFSKYNRYFSIGVVSVQVLTLILLLMSFIDVRKNNVFTTEGITTLSKNKNAIVFVLDAYDQNIFTEVLESKDYNTREVFKDFTSFTNCTSLFPYTLTSIPYLLSGIQYQHSEKYDDYIDRIYNDSNLYKKLKEYNYTASIYTAYPGNRFSPSTYPDVIDNVEQQQIKTVPTSNLSLSLKYMQFCFFKYFPQRLKQLFWLYSGEFVEYIKPSGENEYETFTTSNIDFYHSIQNEWNFQDKNAYKFYDIDGTHMPWTLNKDVNIEDRPNDLTYVDVGIGSLKIVEKFISNMRDAGVYENSLIVLMADHGLINFDQKQHPFLLIKRPHDKFETMQFSDAPISHSDIIPTIIEYVSEEEQKGTVFDYDKNNERDRLFYIHDDNLTDGYVKNFYETIISNDPYAYYITGNIYSPEGIVPLKAKNAKIGEEYIFGKNGDAYEFFTYGLDRTTKYDHEWLWKDAAFTFSLDKKPSDDVYVKFHYKNIRPTPQRINVSYKDKIIMSLTCYKGSGDTLGLYIPREYFDENNSVLLKFNCPDALSNAELGITGNIRKFSLAFDSVAFMYYTPKVAQVGTSYLFGKDGNAAEFFNYGMEKTDKWVQEWLYEDSLFAFNLSESHLNDVKVRLNYSDIRPVEQRVTIYGRNEEILLQETYPPEAPGTMEFVVPKEMFNEDDEVRLRFYCPDGMSNKELGISENITLYTFAFQSVEFEYSD